MGPPTALLYDLLFSNINIISWSLLFHCFRSLLLFGFSLGSWGTRPHPMYVLSQLPCNHTPLNHIQTFNNSCLTNITFNLQLNFTPFESKFNPYTTLSSNLRIQSSTKYSIPFRCLVNFILFFFFLENSFK